MAKKKSGSIAVPFLVTVFLGLLIIGGGAYAVYRYFGLGNSSELQAPTPRPVTTSTYDDNHTILFILDEPDKKCSSTFLLMRSVPKDKKLTFIGIPTNTIAIIDGQQQSLKGSYDRGGASAAISFVNTAFGISIDRYMKVGSDAFIKICDILGGVTYPIDSEIAGFNGDGSEQYLNAEQIETLVTYSVFKEGEVQRASVASSLISDMVNQTNAARVSDSLDSSFNTIINMTESSITAVDYKKRKTAIKNMLERGSSISSFIVLEGVAADGDFIPSQEFLANLAAEYFTDKTDDSSAEETEE